MYQWNPIILQTLERLFSERKKETADMVHSTIVVLDNLVDLISEHTWTARQEVTNDWYPAWSLHRLIEMMPNVIDTQGWLSIGHQGLHYSRGYGVADDGLYESIVRMYEWLIKEGYFKKEYLNEARAK